VFEVPHGAEPTRIFPFSSSFAQACWPMLGAVTIPESPVTLDRITQPAKGGGAGDFAVQGDGRLHGMSPRRAQGAAFV
jgi:hypothetical protein